MLKLYIGNKNYSSWSMRSWVLLTQFGIAFIEVNVRFDSFEAGSAFRRTMDSLSPTGKVPLMVDDELGDEFAVWDTLAIAEYIADKHPDKKIWPQDPKTRARARSLCAEMHSGFGTFRANCPMNIEADLAAVGRIIWRDKLCVQLEVARIVSMWSELLAEHNGPMLMGEFSAIDAYFAPIGMRLQTYALPVPNVITAYIDRLIEMPGVKLWRDAALIENDFLDFEEPYRLRTTPSGK